MKSPDPLWPCGKIPAADTVMSRSNAELVAEVFSEAPVARDLGEHDTLVSVDKPCRVLGYSPQHPVVDPPIDPFNG